MILFRSIILLVSFVLTLLTVMPRPAIFDDYATLYGIVRLFLVAQLLLIFWNLVRQMGKTSHMWSAGRPSLLLFALGIALGFPAAKFAGLLVR